MVDKDGYLLNEGTQQGTKEVFATGARRDTREGKGRYDLISPVALRRLALTLERGAVHYGDRNWEKGMPICRLLDSAVRHLYQYLDGRNDEDHLGHAMFNVMALCHTDSMIYAGMYPQSLDDRPSKGEVDG